MAASRPLGPRVLGVAAVVAVLVTTVAAFGIAGDDDDATAASSTSTSISTSDLGPAARRLLDLLEGAREHTYHARYEGTSPDAPDSLIVLETWQAPPRVRQDSALRVGGQAARTSSFVLPEGGTRCTQLAEGPWSCRAAAAGELQGDVVSDAVIEQLQGSDVRVRATKVGDVDASCFTLTNAEGSNELCLDEDGVTVRVRAGGSELERVELSTDVDDSVFEPPV